MKIIITLILLSIFGIHTRAQKFVEFEENGKFGFKNAAGKVVIPAKYISVRVFSGGLAAVWINKKWGFIDTTGKLVVLNKYDFVGDFSQSGYAFVRIARGEKKGFINKTGKEIIPVKYDEVGEEFRDNLMRVCLNGKCGVSNNLGEIVIDLDYEWCRILSKDLVVVTRKNKDGVRKDGVMEVKSYGINLETKKNIHFQILPFEYDFNRIHWFTKSLLILYKDGKQGLSNLNGMVVLKPVHKFIYPFVDGKARVSGNSIEDIFYIDEEGKQIYE